MLLPNLIIVLLIGGALCWWSERFGNTTPRLIAVLFVLSDLIYLLIAVSGLSDASISFNPSSTIASNWLVSYQVGSWSDRDSIVLERGEHSTGFFSG